MDHIGIDLGSRESQVCVRSEDGTIVEEIRLPTDAMGRYLEKRPAARVILETCAESFHVAEQAKRAGHEVRVVSATLVRAIGVGARRTKTDRRDAQVLSEVSSRVDLPSVHLPSDTSRQRKKLCGMREALVGSRTQLVNCVRGWLRTQAVVLRTGSVRTLTQRLRARFSGLPAHVERMLITIDHLTLQIADADRELLGLAKADETCARLMTVPGVGPVTAVRFVAALDDCSRFSGAHEVQAYLGLVPGENSSSGRRQRLSITKAGSTRVRWALVQAAWSARRSRHRGDPMILWSLDVEKRRGRRVALVALARKLAGILFAIWRDGTTYQSCRGANATSQV